MSLDLSCLFTFGMSTEFNRNILSFIIKVFVCASFLSPNLPLLTIKKKKKYVCIVAFGQSQGLLALNHGCN